MEKVGVNLEVLNKLSLERVDFANTWDTNGIITYNDDIWIAQVEEWLKDMSENTEVRFGLKSNELSELKTKTEGDFLFAKCHDKYHLNTGSIDVDFDMLFQETPKGMSFFQVSDPDEDVSKETQILRDSAFARAVVKWSVASGQNVDTTHMTKNQEDIAAFLINTAEENNIINNDKKSQPIGLHNYRDETMVDGALDQLRELEDPTTNSPKQNKPAKKTLVSA